MYIGTYKFATHSITIRSQYPDVQQMCKKYVTQDEAETFIECSKAELYLEKQTLLNGLDGEQRIMVSNPYMERLAVYRKIAQWMVGKEVLLFHGSVIAVNGKAYLFTAKSGTGKSTHARLWRELLGDRATMINDDKPLIIAKENEIIACGTPWSGKHHLDSNQCVPLHGIAILSRSSNNRICMADPDSVWPVLLQQAYRPNDPGQMKIVLQLLDRIRKNTPIWELQCNMALEAAQISYEAMSGKEFNEDKERICNI